MKRKGCIIAGVGAGCLLIVFLLLPGFMLGAGPLFRLLHLEGDSYDRYANGGWYSGANPTISPDDRTIVYSSPRTGRGDLYSVKRDGTGTKQLTTSPLYEAEPCFSPNGRQIVFVRQMKDVGNSYHSHLWIMNTDGTAQRQVTTDNAEYDFPTFMNDGQHIFCMRSVQSPNVVPVIVAISDGSHREVVEPRGATELVTNGGVVVKSYSVSGYSFAASPDGKRVTYVSEPYSQTLWIMNADGTGSRQIYTNQQHYLEHPVFTHDGKSILFHEVHDQGVGDIMLIDANGTNPKSITTTR